MTGKIKARNNMPPINFPVFINKKPVMCLSFAPLLVNQVLKLARGNLINIFKNFGKYNK